MLIVLHHNYGIPLHYVNEILLLGLCIILMVFHNINVILLCLLT